MSAVLITVQDGAVDYVADGTVQVVIVDFDSFDPDSSFPEDVDLMIEQVLSLPPTIPWRGGVVRRLNEVKKACKEALVSVPAEPND